MIPCRTMRIVGIDEAGYGPLLGPLTVGAVWIEVKGDYEPRRIWDALGVTSGIADSKKVLGHRNMAAGEETILALLSTLKIEALTRRDLFDQLLLAPPNIESDAQAPWSCGLSDAFARRACRPDDTDIPRWGAMPDEDRVLELRSRLRAADCRLGGASVISLCPGRFNDALERGANKASINWSLFSQQLQHIRSWLGTEGFAACGKLGGRHRYGGLLMDLGLSVPLEEGRARSAYDVDGFGRVEFLRSAEDAHPPVAMASMLAKLVREHVLDQWHQMFRVEVGDLTTCSGYHDPVTRRYVERTVEARRRLGIPDRCFLRNR